MPTITFAYPVARSTTVIFIIDEPRESCDVCPVAKSGDCNGRLSTKAKLTAHRDVAPDGWTEYLQEIGARCNPRIER